LLSKISSRYDLFDRAARIDQTPTRLYSPIDLAAFITTTYSFCRDDEDLAASAAAPHTSLVRRGGFEKSLATGYFDTALFIRAL
jgi:hypothetical protein